MADINKLLDTISDFRCTVSNEQISFMGVLAEVNGDYILNARIAKKDFIKFKNISSISIWGEILGTPVSFLDTYILSGKESFVEEYYHIIFDPSQIVVGKSYSSEPEVSQIMMVTSSLNWMIEASPLETVSNFSKNNPSVVKYTYPDVLSCKDKYGELSIFSVFSETFSRNELRLPMSICVEYSFSTPLFLMDAVEKLASTRNLFTFFANHYLPLENISFLENVDDNELTLYLNHNEHIEVNNDSFLITSKDFSSNFDLLWNRWLKFDDESQITALFYEIVCNRSTRANRFLNLTQALEIFSRIYRQESVQKFANIHEKCGEGKKIKPHLEHRLADIFLSINDYFKLEENDIFAISKSVADLRNYYTHYDNEKYFQPSYQELFAAIHILEFSLFSIIYMHLGLSGESVISHISNSLLPHKEENIQTLKKDFKIRRM